MSVFICLLLLIFSSMLLKCTAQNHHQLCQNRLSIITCTCNSIITQLELEDDHDGFFEEAKNITIKNCELVHLTPPSLVNAELLKSLYLLNNGKVILDTEFPRSFSTLVIINVTNMVELHKPLFNKRQHMILLKIHNSTIAKISKHTFSELRVERIELSNSRFYNLTENSILFSDKQIQSPVKMPFHVSIKECEFMYLPSYAIAFIGAQNVNIENVKFTGALNKTALFIFATIATIRENTFQDMNEKAVVISDTTQIYFVKNRIGKVQNNSLYFNLSSVNTFMFKENILPCHCKSVCNAQTTTILNNIEDFYNRYRGPDFNLCSLAQSNFCSQKNSISQIIHLQKQCDTDHFLYNKLKHLNCLHSENDEIECKSKAYTNSASFIFTLHAIALSVFSVQSFLFCV